MNVLLQSVLNNVSMKESYKNLRNFTINKAESSASECFKQCEHEGKL